MIRLTLRVSFELCFLGKAVRVDRWHLRNLIPLSDGIRATHMQDTRFGPHTIAESPTVDEEG